MEPNLELDFFEKREIAALEYGAEMGLQCYAGSEK